MYQTRYVYVITVLHLLTIKIW